MKRHSVAACAAVLLVAATARGAESADYSLTSSSPATGQRAASGDYTLDSSTDRGGAASSPVYQDRGGFAGVLSDAVGLEILADPPSVTEGGSRQLTALLSLDDGSQSRLAASSVAWSVLAGPASVDGSGLVTAGGVTADGAATIQGDWQAFTDSVVLTVLDSVRYDYASDSIPDDWQTAYFGTGNPGAAPDRDPDGDGSDNFFEYTAGLDPTDPGSAFHVRVETVAGQPSHRKVIFSPVVAGRQYLVLASPSLSGWQPLAGAPVADHGNERTVTDTSATAAATFYQVAVELGGGP